MSWVVGLLGTVAAGLIGAVLLIGVVIAQMPWLGGGLATGPDVTTAAALVLTVATPIAVPVPTIAPGELTSNDAVERTIAAATTWLGVPYRWGGCTRSGVDCSCFVQNALLVGAGIRAPRVTVDQIRWATPIPVTQMRRGDLIFFRNTCTGCGPNPTHVAMYLGGGQFIHAGDPVQISSTNSDLFRSHFQAVGRPPGF